METNSNLVNLLIKEFEKNKKIGDSYEFTFTKKCTVITSSSVSIFLKSGNKYVNFAFHSYYVIKYPTQKEPIVKISLFENDSSRVFTFPREIMVIPVESIESVNFLGSGKIGIIGYHKNKKKL